MRSRLTASSKDRDMDTELGAQIGQVQGTDDIAANGGFLVVLTPINVGTTGATGAVQHVGGLDSLQFSLDSFTIFHANCR